MGQRFEPMTAAHCVLSGAAYDILGPQTIHIQACYHPRHRHGPSHSNLLNIETRHLLNFSLFELPSLRVDQESSGCDRQHGVLVDLR